MRGSGAAPLERLVFARGLAEATPPSINLEAEAFHDQGEHVCVVVPDRRVPTRVRWGVVPDGRSTPRAQCVGPHSPFHYLRVAVPNTTY